MNFIYDLIYIISLYVSAYCIVQLIQYFWRYVRTYNMILQIVEKNHTDNNCKFNNIKCDVQFNNIGDIRKDNVDNKLHAYKEELLEKLDILRKLGELESSGIEISKKYNIDADIKEMQYEYKLHFDRKKKENTILWLRYMFILIMKSIEDLNEKYSKCNPFYFKIKGLAEIINSNDQLNSVLNDVYDRYIVNIDWESVKNTPIMRILSLISNYYLEDILHIQSKSNHTKHDKNIQSIKNILTSLDKDQYDKSITQLIDQICPNETDPEIVKVIKDIIDEIKHAIENSNGNINTNIIMQNVAQKLKNKIPYDKLQKTSKLIEGMIMN